MKVLEWLKRNRADIRRKSEVRKNRARHPDLMERDEQGENSIAIAQLMLIRDRRALHDEGIEPDDPRYPNLFDYYVENSVSRQSFLPFRRGLRFLFTGKSD